MKCLSHCPPSGCKKRPIKPCPFQRKALMASDFPRSPRVLKGAMVVFDSPMPGPPPRIIVFQYNPESLSRTLSLRAAPPDPGSIGDSREESHKVMGPPLESITVSVMLDAADQLENPANNPDVVTKGLHPALAALEMLLYPTTAQVLRNKTLASAGAVQICAAELPLTLLVWGVSASCLCVSRAFP